jgi:hypothetical protein
LTVREARPESAYYELRAERFSQGDIFRDVPLAYPVPAQEIVFDEHNTGARVFLSGPFDVGFAILLTPTCSMTAQRTPGEGYAHPVRCLGIIRPASEMMKAGILDFGRLGLLRKYDSLINYMYLPEMPDHAFPESVALLYMTVTLHHDLIDGQRIAQLTVAAAQQLQRKLVHYSTSLVIPRADFAPPMT